jgi:hypothetical protein
MPRSPRAATAKRNERKKAGDLQAVGTALRRFEKSAVMVPERGSTPSHSSPVV